MTVPTAVAASRTNPASSIAIVGVLFFVIGFFTWLNGPLITFVGWPSNSRGRRLPGADGVLPVLFLPRIACVVDPRRTGMKKGLALSLVVMAAGRRCSAVRHPALVSGRWPACS
jgi:hypothetical protein